MESAENRKLLMEEFSSWLKLDPVKTTLVDMTALELVEITRKNSASRFWINFWLPAGRKKQLEKRK